MNDSFHHRVYGQPKGSFYVWGLFPAVMKDAFQKMYETSGNFKGHIYLENNFVKLTPISGPPLIATNDNQSKLLLTSFLSRSTCLVTMFDCFDLILVLIQNELEHLICNLRLSQTIAMSGSQKKQMMGLNHILTSIKKYSEDTDKTTAAKIARYYLSLFMPDADSLEDMQQLLAGEIDYQIAGILSTVFLRAGDLQYGWPCYQRAVRQFLENQHSPAIPWWNSEDLNHKKLLLRRINMGIGDEIMYSQIFKNLHSQKCQLTIEVDWRLVSIFERSFPYAEIIARTSPYSPVITKQSYDFQMSYSDAFRIFRSRIDDFPVNGTFLKAKADLVDNWNTKLHEISQGKPMVGFCWSSSTPGGGEHENQTLEDWLDLLKSDRIQFLSLGYHNEASQECRDLNQHYGTNIVHIEELDFFYDLEELAAFISNLDAVISVHCANYHLANALRIKTWLTAFKDLHILLNQDFDPYWPQARVFLWDKNEGPYQATKAIIESIEELLI